MPVVSFPMEDMQCVFTDTSVNRDYKNNADIVNEKLTTKAIILVNTSTNRDYKNTYRARKQEFSKIT